jgi:hypothetical protein
MRLRTGQVEPEMATQTGHPEDLTRLPQRRSLKIFSHTPADLERLTERAVM